jgi:hypothetical protein
VGIDIAAGRAAVVPDSRVAAFLAQVVQRRLVAGPDRVLDRLPMRTPSLGGLLVACTAGLHFLRLERGVQHRHALLNAERRVQEGDVAAFSLLRVQPQLFTPFSVRVRLSVQ